MSWWGGPWATRGLVRWQVKPTQKYLKRLSNALVGRVNLWFRAALGSHTEPKLGIHPKMPMTSKYEVRLPIRKTHFFCLRCKVMGKWYSILYSRMTCLDYHVSLAPRVTETEKAESFSRRGGGRHQHNRASGQFNWFVNKTTKVIKLTRLLKPDAAQRPPRRSVQEPFGSLPSHPGR